MSFVTSIFFSGLAPYSTSTLSTMAGALSANVIKDFFMNIFMNPGNHFIPVAIFGGVCIAACVGLAYLIKMVYEKTCHKVN
jgi:hypothetical protein